MRAAPSLLAVLVATLVPAAAAAPPAEDAVARVNGQAILRRDFDLAVQLQFRGRAASLGLEELRAIRGKVLERLIESELLHQRASKGGVEVREADVEAELKSTQEAFGSAEAFAAVLRENGVGEAEFRAQIRRSLRITRFVDREIAGDITIGAEDLRRYYDQNPREMTRQERVRVRQILIRAPADPPAARAAGRQKIEAILKELRSGQDFADLARRHSEGPEAGRDGDAGWLTRGAAPLPIERAVFQLRAGEVSDIVETRIGFHLLRVEERQAAGPIPFDDAKEAIRARLVTREREARIKDYVAGLSEKAHIERLLAPPSP